MKSRSLFFLLIFSAVSVSFRPQQSDRYAREISAIEEFVKSRMASDKTPGVSVAFMKDDFIWAKGFGYADLENNVPATEHSSYRLASVTKPMTATAILQLVEQGKINLDADVQTYVPYFPRKKWPVTVRLLLGHIGGISHYKNEANELHIKKPKTTKEAIAIFQDFELIAEPGTRYSYSSYGYNLLGAVIEGASGMSYGDYMKKNIWDRVGMDETHMDNPRAIIPNRVKGYELVGGQVRNSEFVDISSRFSAGGTRSTVLDLLKFAKGLNDGKLIVDSTHTMMSQPMVLKNGRYTTYGMGWQIDATLGRVVLYHSGGQQETRTALYSYPGLNFIVAVGCNYENTNPFAYADAVVREVLGEPTSIPSYTSDRSLDAVRRTLYSVISMRPKDIETYGQRSASIDKELSDAFQYFNTWVNKATFDTAYETAGRRAAEGRHPAAGKPFTKVGAFMTSMISKTYGQDRVDGYFKTGVIPFFADYVQVYKYDQSIPAELKFTKEFESTIERWNNDWQRTWTPEIRALTVSASSDFDAVGKLLRTTFQGAELYPNVVDGFAESIRTLTVQGQKEKALDAGALGTEIYPSSDLTNCYYGLALTLFGDAIKGQPFLEKAVKINPTGVAGPGSLNNIAYSLAGMGKQDAGMTVLNVAVRLHPKEANLYDSIGEFYLKKGDKEKAIEYYKKALEINPQFESAKKALDEIMKSTLPK